VHDHLAETPLEGSCNVFIYEESPTLSFDDSALPNLCSFPSPSPKYHNDVPIDNPIICDANVDLGYEDNMFDVLGGNINDFLPLGYFSGYNTSLDLYYMYLLDEPRKIMWNTFFDLPFDFSMAFDLLKKALSFFIVIILMLSYCHACESLVVTFDRLLHALITLIWRAKS